MNSRTTCTLLGLLLCWCVANTCIAQENDRFGEALDEAAAQAADGESRGASPQKKAALAAEDAQQRNDELLRRQMTARRQHEELARKRDEQAAAEQQALAEQQYRKALERNQQVQHQLGEQHPQFFLLEQQLQQLDAKRNELEQQMAHLKAAEMAARQQQQHARPPKDGMLKVFALRHSRAPDAARVISEILGADIARMAIDERVNSLIVYSDAETLNTVEALMARLDAPAGSYAESKPPGQTLQLRVVWLLDIDEGMEPTEKLVSPQVVEALHEIGFTSPKVVCQQVTTLTLSDDGGRRGRFNFDVPVLVKSQPWQFEGQGQIESMADERFNLRFDLQFREVQRGGQQGQLGGAIYTPLGHYTVMGTTTFVATQMVRAEGVPVEVNQNQHLSAFVVYLDRAREFPAAEAPSNDRRDVRR